LHRNPLGLHRSVEKKHKYKPAFRRNAPLKKTFQPLIRINILNKQNNLSNSKITPYLT
jgi:hypothetical protein